MKAGKAAWSDAMSLLAMPRVCLRILRFYASTISEFSQVHPDLPSGRLFETIASKQADGGAEIQVSAKFKLDFNAKTEKLKSDLNRLLGTRAPDFEKILFLSFSVRAVQCVVAFVYGWQLALLAGLGQFVVAPLSFTGSIIRLLTNISECLFHYSLNAAVSLALLPFLAALPALPKLTLDSNFIAVFLIADFFLNLFVYFNTSENFGVRRLAVHIAYGTFNTKTYFVVVLGCLYGLQLDILTILATSLLSRYMEQAGHFERLLRLAGWPCFPICFYVEHRIGHMPHVYQHAHKMHHYLHDSTAFDAHIYGSGMNEEFFWILAEVLPCLAFPGTLFPYFLNLTTLWSSWTNKGGHTRTAEGVSKDAVGVYDVDNWHADHHTFHRANFSASGMHALLDFYFGTQGAGSKGSFGLAISVTPDPSDDESLLLRVKPATGDNRAPPAPAELDDFPPPRGEVRTTADRGDLRVVTAVELATKTSAEEGVWVALHGGVFDVTKFLRGHPGGAQVLVSHAGTDATSTFDEIGHSERAMEMSKRWLIGKLDGQALTGFLA